MEAVGPGQAQKMEQGVMAVLLLLVKLSLHAPFFLSNHTHSALFYVLCFIITFFFLLLLFFLSCHASSISSCHPLPFPFFFFNLLTLYFLLFALHPPFFNSPFCPFCPSLQLVASNMEGKSSPSEVLVCTTNPDKPGPPTTPCVTAATPYGFTVTWGKDAHIETDGQYL